MEAIASFPQTRHTWVAGILLYIGLVRWMRYRRSQEHEQLVANADSEAELLEANRRIVSDGIANLEFPLVHRISLELAIFRTYAIPSISKLLMNTKKFISKPGLRYDDTDLLIREIIDNPFPLDRSQTALKRLNAIHSHFPISNEDMLYVLSVFVFEPARCIGQFEWRALTETEKEALFRVWLHIGTGMGIRDIPSSRAKLEAFAVDYETKNMVYAPSNVSIANATIQLFLALAPAFLHDLVKKAVYCLMDERLRKACGYPDPIPWLQTAVLFVLWLRKMVIRYLSLPRPAFLNASRLQHDRPVQASARVCPRYHVYEKSYQSYVIADLGNAPHGKLAETTPVYKK